MPPINGDDILDEQLGGIENKKRLLGLLARCSMWARREIVQYVDTNNHERYEDRLNTIGGVWFPGTARGRPATQGGRNQTNEKARDAIWAAVGLERNPHTFHVCHVWEETATDPQHYTALANLVILPRALAGLSDHWRLAQEFLQWKSYQLFRWSPNGQQPAQVVEGISFLTIDRANPPKSDDFWTKGIEGRDREKVERRQLDRLEWLF